MIAYAKTSSSQYKNKDNTPEKWIIARGRHRGAVPGRDFSKVQKLLERNRAKGNGWRKAQNPVALLSGLLYCSCGHLMRPKNYAGGQETAKGERKFSYLCPYKDMTHGERCATANVQGNTLDELVCREVFRHAEAGFDGNRMLGETIRRMEETKEERGSEGELLGREIENRKKEVKNLIGVLAKTQGDEEFVRQIEEEIGRLNGECAALEKEKAKLGAEEEDGFGERGQLEFLMEQMKNFKNLSGSLNVLEKREYLRMILDKVVWDGERAHIFIYGSHG